MTLSHVQSRILIVGAWLLGVGTATGGSLIGVSLLGQGLFGPGSQQLTVAAVNRALASEAAEPAASRPARSAAPHVPKPHAAAPASPMSTASPSLPANTGAGTGASPGPGDSAGGTGTLLSSGGGDVVATCSDAGAYLTSWSPNQGFEATNVVRGPAATATVTFQSQQSGVTMQVTCNGGVPETSNSPTQGTGGGDN